MISPKRALEIVNDCKVIAYDVETSGLDRNAFVCGYVITGDGDSVYVPVRHVGGGNIVDYLSFELSLRDGFRERGRKGLRTVGHNIAFDLRMSRRHGIKLYSPLEDTMINEGLIYDVAPSYSLDACAERRGVTPKLGHDLYAEMARRFGGIPDRKQMGNFYKMPGDHPLVVDYSVGDGVSTLELWAAQQPLLDTEFEERSLRAVHELECALIPYIDKMNEIGLRIDQDYAERILKQLEQEIDEASSYFPRGFNVSSGPEVQQLFDSLGITNYPRTSPTTRFPNGSPSFREKWLETNEHGQAILRVRRLRKARDSFIVPLINTHFVDGRVYPQLNQSKSDDYGAIGGRLSCSDPNLQAFPKRNKEVGRIVRPLVIPDKDMLLEEDDLEQQEPRLFGHYSEDENILAGYRSKPPIDIHSNTQKLLGIPIRDDAKRLAMGMLTGLGYEGLAGHIGKDLEEATSLHKQFLEDAFPGIRQFQIDAKATAKARGYVRTLLGRIANLPDKRFAYRAISRIIQGSGADIAKRALLWICQFAEAEGNIQILMTIHDSFIHQSTPDANVRELRRIIESVAPSFDLLLPIPVETAGRAKNWADASYGSPHNLDPYKGSLANV